MADIKQKYWSKNLYQGVIFVFRILQKLGIFPK
jgi:hypothetical protein